MFKGTSNQPLVSTSIATSVVSPSVYPSAYAESVSGVGTETLSLGQFIAGTQTATVGGTATTGDELSIEVTNSALAGGLESASYTVPSGSPSTTTMAAGLASAINADTHLQAIGVTATSTGAVVTIAANATTYTTTNGATEILTVYPLSLIHIYLWSTSRPILSGLRHTPYRQAAAPLNRSRCLQLLASCSRPTTMSMS